MIRELSLKINRIPCLVATDPSMGSVYLPQQVLNQKRGGEISSYENSSAQANALSPKSTPSTSLCSPSLGKLSFTFLCKTHEVDVEYKTVPLRKLHVYQVVHQAISSIRAKPFIIKSSVVIAPELGPMSLDNILYGHLRATIKKNSKDF